MSDDTRERRYRCSACGQIVCTTSKEAFRAAHDHCLDMHPSKFATAAFTEIETRPGYGTGDYR
jgi:hypothetical protein